MSNSLWVVTLSSLYDIDAACDAVSVSCTYFHIMLPLEHDSNVDTK